jgi:hypothetical protein
MVPNIILAFAKVLSFVYALFARVTQTKPPFKTSWQIAIQSFLERLANQSILETEKDSAI